MRIRILSLLLLVLAACSPGPFSTPQGTPTSHPIPTPPTMQSTEIALWMLRTNNGCSLPCWWGITPNETHWSDAENFLKIFSHISASHSSNQWDVYEVRSPLPSEYSEVGEVRAIFGVQDGMVKEIRIGYFDENRYHLSGILQRYGPPTETLVSTFSADQGLPRNQVPLSVDLEYPEKGINLLYGTYANVSQGQILGCLEKSPEIFLWSPAEHSRSIDYILGWDRNHTPYMSIDKASGLDLQDFYEKYQNPNNMPCLQTPASLWPAQ